VGQNERRDCELPRGIVIAARRNTSAKRVGTSMVDREKIVAVLQKRFAGAAAGQIAAAANAIVGLDDEWEELTDAEGQCSESCYLIAQTEAGARFKVFRRRQTD
jgi:hypothetical protein